MKKVFLTAMFAVLGLGSTAYAQISQGTLSIGGGISFTSSKEGEDDDEASKYFELSPNFGYFVADNLEIGVEVTVATEAEGDFSSRGFGAGPYIRKYFSLGETAFIYGQGGVAFGSGKAEWKSDELYNFSTLEIGVKPGFMFRPSDRLGIDLTAGFLGYSSSAEEDVMEDEKNETSEFGLTFDMRNVTLGVKLFF